MTQRFFRRRPFWPHALPAIVVFAALSGGARCELMQLVVPNSYSDAEAVAYGAWPDRVRAQYIYRADQFDALPDGGAYLTSIRWRPDGATAGDPPDWFDDDLTIAAAVTTTAPDNMSYVFGDNFAGQLTTVRESGPWQGGTENRDADGQPGGPKAFDIEFVLDSPFRYNPAEGNLLLEIFGQGPQSAPLLIDRLATDDLSEAAVMVAWSWDPEGPIPDTAYVNGYVGAMPAQLTFVALPGDFSSNGMVENADLTLLLNNWAQAVPPRPDGWIGSPLTEPAIDNDELTALLNHWGASFGGGAVAHPALNGKPSVPEPASLVLLLVAAAAIVARSRR